MFDHCLMGFHPSIATPSVLFVVWLGSGKQCILGVAETACRGHIYIVIVYYGNICKITNVWFYAWYIWEISVIENQQNLWVVFFQSFQEQKFHGVQGDSKPPQQMTQTFAAFQGTIDPWFKSKNGQHKIPWDELKQKHGCCFVCGSSGEITCFQISCFYRLPGLFRRKWLEHPKRNWAQAFWCGGKESWSFWIKGIRHFSTCNMIYVTVSLVFQFFPQKMFSPGSRWCSSSFIGWDMWWFPTNFPYERRLLPNFLWASPTFGSPLRSFDSKLVDAYMVAMEVESDMVWCWPIPETSYNHGSMENYP